MIQTILESGIATGSLFALVLNLVLPKASVPAPEMAAREESNEKLEESNFSG
jgi:xanthine/uracil permease